MIKPISRSTDIILSPAAEEKLSSINKLTNEFTNLSIEYNELVSVIKPNLECKYNTTIGDKEYKLLILKIKVSSLKRRIELIQSYLNRGESPDFPVISKKIKKEFTKWNAEIRKVHEKLQEAERHASLAALTDEDAARLKELYRILVKKLHPDLNSNLTEDDKVLWERVISAFKQGNLEELEVLFILAEQYECSETMKTETEINNKLSLLKKKIKNLMVKINTLNSEFPLNIKEKIYDIKWIQQKQKELEKEINCLNQKKNELKNIIKDIIDNEQ